MAISGSDEHRLVTILAEMIQSALAWENENGTPGKDPDHDGRKGVDGKPQVYTLRPTEARRDNKNRRRAENHDGTDQR